MAESHAYLVYSNLPAFFASRRWRPAADAPPLGAAAFGEEAGRVGYVRVDAFRGDGGRVAVLVLDAGSRQAEQAAKLRDLVEAVARGRRGGAAAAEVVVFAEPATAAKRGEALAGLRQDVGVPVTLRPYDPLVVVVPEVRCVPRHELYPPEKVPELLGLLKCRLADLPAVTVNDPPVFWVGAKVGDVVRITGPSETVGETVQFRRVIA